MLKIVLFRAHWLIGLIAGIVLALVGLTGGLMSFEQELLEAINPGVMRVSPRDDAPLAPPQLIASVNAQFPHKKISSLTIERDPAAAVRVAFATERPKQGLGGARLDVRFFDPYSGMALEPPVGLQFFRTVRELHRWLLLDEPGKQIVGASTIGLVILALTGLYLRWPRRFTDLRAWFALNTKLKGRSFLWNLHAVFGAWLLLPYLLMALTGLYWSYDWYRDGLYTLTGTPKPTAQARSKSSDGKKMHSTSAPTDWTPAWNRFMTEAKTYERATLRVPDHAGRPLQINYLPIDASHMRASNRISIQADGEVREHERYADKVMGAKLIGSNYALHVGEFFGLPGRIIFFVASVFMPLFAITGWLLYLDRRKTQTAAKKIKRSLPPSTVGSTAEWLIAFASQSGGAERLAWQTAGALQSGGVAVAVHPLGSLTSEMLRRFERALFVVSSFGEGQAPDAARKFERKLMRQSISLSRLRFGLLSLGDRQYASFCGFGRSLYDWLSQQGAQPLFETVEVDRSDARALKKWQRSLQRLGAAQSGASEWQSLPAHRARLIERRLLNPHSLGGPVFHVVLEPEADLHWEAGDLLRVQPRNAPIEVEYWLAHAGLDGESMVDGPLGACTLQELLSRCVLPPFASVNELGLQAVLAALQPLAARSYTIGSLKETRGLELLIRQERLQEGRLGIGSGWLTEYAALGARIDIEVQPNPTFRLPEDERPLLLIGNGTGLAGLRSLIKERARRGHHANWLIYGERQADRDFHYRDELDTWRARGVLASMDLAFSRDRAERVYVQHRLLESADQVREWIARGAAVYVCGSAIGMATGVDEALRAILGANRFAALNENGLYRRDVY